MLIDNGPEIYESNGIISTEDNQPDSSEYCIIANIHWGIRGGICERSWWVRYLKYSSSQLFAQGKFTGRADFNPVVSGFR